MSIRVLESASAQDETLVHVTLSLHHNAAAAASPSPSRVTSQSKSEALDSFASLEATKTADQRRPSAPTIAGKPAAESQIKTAPKQQPPVGADSQACERLGIPTLPEVPFVTSTASTAESLQTTMGSAPGSRVLGSAIPQSWGLPLPWPLPSWRPATTTAATAAATTAATIAATTAAISATTTAAMTAVIPARKTTMLNATIPAATPAARSAASEAQATADSQQKLESSLTDKAFHGHGVFGALALPNASSPSTTAHAFASNMSSDSPRAGESWRSRVSEPGSESAQLLESTQHQHVPNSAPKSGLSKHLPLSAAESVKPAAVADADSVKTATSQNGLQHRHDHPHVGAESSAQLDEPSFERTAPEAAPGAQEAAPDSAEHDYPEPNLAELAQLKPEQQALLAKGLQLCIQVHQV